MPWSGSGSPAARGEPGVPMSGRQDDSTAMLATRGDGIVLRRAQHADLPMIVSLLADDPIGGTRESAPASRYEAAFALIDSDPGELLVVAVDGDTILGSLQLSILPGLSRGGALRAQIEGVRIARGHRGSGLGRWMLQWAIDEAERRGCALVQLTTDKQRLEAHHFYCSLGFVASHEGMKLHL